MSAFPVDVGIVVAEGRLERRLVLEPEQVPARVVAVAAPCRQREGARRSCRTARPGRTASSRCRAALHPAAPAPALRSWRRRHASPLRVDSGRRCRRCRLFLWRVEGRQRPIDEIDGAGLVRTGSAVHGGQNAGGHRLHDLGLRFRERARGGGARRGLAGDHARASSTWPRSAAAQAAPAAMAARRNVRRVWRFEHGRRPAVGGCLETRGRLSRWCRDYLAKAARPDRALLTVRRDGPAAPWPATIRISRPPPGVDRPPVPGRRGLELHRHLGF